MLPRRLACRPSCTPRARPHCSATRTPWTATPRPSWRTRRRLERSVLRGQVRPQRRRHGLRSLWPPPSPLRLARRLSLRRLPTSPARSSCSRCGLRPGTVAAEVVLRDAGLTPSSSVSWARLRVSVVAFHPFDAARVRGRLGGMRPRFSHRIPFASWRCVMCADQLRGVPVCKFVSPLKPHSVVAGQDLPAAHEPCEALASILCCVAGCPRIVRPDESWVERDVCKSALPYLSDAHARHRWEARGFAVCGCARIRPRGMDMKDRVSPEIVRMCERWSGGQRLRDVVCSFGEQSPATWPAFCLRDRASVFASVSGFS
jgi:hypothetical protein